MKNLMFVLISLWLVSGCKNQNPVKPETNERLTMATIFVQHAPEYKALCYQAYNLAAVRLKEEIAANTEQKKLAVVLDIDETVLNNIPFQATQVRDELQYPTCWNEWCNMEAAEPVPGVVSFLQEADRLGVAIFYISNRKTNVLSSTINNLRKVGLPQADSAHVLLRVSATEKETRRQQVLTEGYEIVLLFGDNLSDFSADYEITDNLIRNKTAIEQAELFGNRFIVLPNPGYGTWTQNLGLNNSKINQDSLEITLMQGIDCP